MLHNISWFDFAKVVATVTIVYYLAIIVLFFRKEAIQFLTRQKKPLLLIIAMALAGAVGAQDPNAGINQANTMMRGMFDSASQLMYAIGAVLALIGAVRTYKEWNAGHQQEAWRAATGWFGSCIFLILVTTIIKSFFGL